MSVPLWFALVVGTPRTWPHHRGRQRTLRGEALWAHGLRGLALRPVVELAQLHARALYGLYRLVGLRHIESFLVIFCVFSALPFLQ